MKTKTSNIIIFILLCFSFICSSFCFALDNGYEFGEEFQVNTYTSNSQQNPAIATNGLNYLVVWESDAENNIGIYGQLISYTGLRIGEEFNISVNGTNMKPSIASNGSTYLVVWENIGQDGDIGGIYGQFLSSNATQIGDQFQINQYTTNNQIDASVASDGTNYFIVWESYTQDGSQNGIFGRLIDDIGTFITSEIQINSYTLHSQIDPSITFNIDKYLVVWASHGQLTPEGDIYGQFLSKNGLKIGSESLINTYTAQGQDYPFVNSNGTKFLVTWRSYGQEGGDMGEIYGQFINADRTLQNSEFHINTYTTNMQVRPYVAYSEDKFLVTWDAFRGQIISSDGNFIGSEFLITEYSNLFLPASSGKNNFLIIFQKGNPEDIYAKMLTYQGPSILTQPFPEVCFKGEKVTFRILASTSTGELHYQWYKNGIPVGIDNNELIIQNPQLSDNDSIIYCNVSNCYTTVQSDFVTLTVLEPLFEIVINGVESIKEYDLAVYTAHARYGSGPDFDEYDVTNYAVWLILEPDNYAEFVSPGVLKTYNVDKDKNITIRASLTDAGETHWCDFSVEIDSCFQVTAMNPLPETVLHQAPLQIELLFNEEIDNESVSEITCFLAKAGNDNKFDTSDDTMIPLFFDTSNPTKIIFDISDSLLPNDIYRVKLSGIKNDSGSNLDGEYIGSFPSGDGISGGDFIASFSISRQISSIDLKDNDTITLTWLPFRPGIVYRIEATENLIDPNWLPLEPIDQWPIEATTWTGFLSSSYKNNYRVVGIKPYIKSISPVSGALGTFSLFVDIIGYGTKWNEGDISLSLGDGITVNSLNVINSQHISAELRISFNTELGSRDLVITSGTNVFIKENAFEIVE
ncbi:MAG: hypothetical protein C4541_06890 [Candidatus Auribacter fodinae]|jgi:methionine-rich copper-binding protein CopC|uniref:Ig-like domain-containing protein n=1 Tax=Candidatus Auribacter fodinae TaxID=2093366 RepID=A0A3A4R9R4_9BACT|nr:MAG: hypothetical protein C4541_06890 [Candidatus Auribacter fodinae]